MGFCIKHSQSYEEKLGGFCVYCGNPANITRPYASSTGGAPQVGKCYTSSESKNILGLDDDKQVLLENTKKVV